MEQEDFALTVADAPSVAVNRVATYTELDNDLFKHAAFATLEEIDLRWHYLHIYISTYLHIYVSTRDDIVTHLHRGSCCCSPPAGQHGGIAADP